LCLLIASAIIPSTSSLVTYSQPSLPIAPRPKRHHRLPAPKITGCLGNPRDRDQRLRASHDLDFFLIIFNNKKWGLICPRLTILSQNVSVIK
jgi:hypothetical protein